MAAPTAAGFTRLPQAAGLPTFNRGIGRKQAFACCRAYFHSRALEAGPCNFPVFGINLYLFGNFPHQAKWRAEADRDTERGRRSRTAWRNGDAPLPAAPSSRRCGDATASTCEDARDPEGRAQGCGRLACDDARGPGAAVFCFVPHVKYLAELARFTGVRIFEEGHCALERQFPPPEK